MRPLESVARRLVWWKPAQQTMQYPRQLLARGMVYGTLSDLQTLLGEYGEQALLDVLEHAPSGVFDRRSWRYWHVVLNRPVPPIPVRTFEYGLASHAARP